MAPSPETDNTPKAPDKVEKGKCARESEPRGPGASSAADNVVKEISVTSLDDGQLRTLLEEAITYKTPRDREGKSELFKTLLTDAEDELRKDLAKTASGSELARYYNTTANRRRSKRQPSSISENLTHGGSLNDLAKEELYESANHLQRPKKTVSARQREGGSLPCNVNAGASYDKQFFLEEQAKRRNNISEKLEYTAIDIESEFLLENDSLGQEYNNSGGELEVVQTRLPRIPNVYTSKATLQITGVDDYIQLPFERGEKGPGTGAAVDESYKHMQDMAPHYGLLTMNSNKFNSMRSAVMEEKKVDENGNALAQNSAVDTKKRKKSGKKAEGVMKAEDVKGHRADIINNIEMLLEFISGTEEKSKTSVKSKLHKHMSEDKGKQHKQRTRSSKGTKAASNDHHSALQKSNSLEEVSITKLEDFHFDSKDHVKSESSKAPLRPTKSNADRRERKSWVICSELYHASAENLETADFTFVTKKKKSKKRRNSLGSRKQVHVGEVRAAEFHRVPSPRRKSVCSAPHSEKSIDSSDAESVNSLSMDYADMEPLNQPASYADIAKSAEKPKCSKQTVEKKKPSEKPAKVEPPVAEPNPKVAKPRPEAQEPPAKPPKEPSVSPPVNCALPKPTDVPPQPVSRNDLNSLQNWPEIRNNKVNMVKRVDGPQEWPTIQNNNGFKDPPSNDNKLRNTMVPRTNKPVNNVRNNKSPQKPLDEQESPMQPGIVKENNMLNSTHQVVRKVSEQQQKFDYQCQMPPNIRDVQSIEKMQYKSLHNISFPNNGSGEPACLEEMVQSPKNSITACAVAAVSHCEVDKRPAVVILSGGDRHISDITFGFDINEQLLSGDVCADFMSRFFVPETPQAVHIEKLVDYIGTEWEDVLVQTNGGKVKYYTDEL